MSQYGAPASSLTDQLAEKLSNFHALDTDQTNFLRSIFLSFSTRPDDQTHVQEFVKKQYRDIPAESRGALGQGILELFKNEERDLERARAARTQAALEGKPPPVETMKIPAKITWSSFQRVCSAIGLHLTEDIRGMQAIRKFSSADPAAAAALANVQSRLASSSDPAQTAKLEALQAVLEPGMTFEDFMVFYAGLTKVLSPLQELKEIFRLLDEDFDGLVDLHTLRQAFIGMEFISPSNDPNNAKAFYQTKYKFHWDQRQKQLSKEQLVDELFEQHFKDKKFREQPADKIDFQQFVEFLHAP